MNILERYIMAYLGEHVKKLGFGLMRLPQNGGKIDIEQTKQMVDLFMDAGCTYFDTAWAYAGSEDAIRQALVERYPRGSFTIATKNAAWIGCKTREDAVSQFETSLRQTGAGYIDFYLLHNLGDSRTEVFDKFDLWNFVQQKKKEGLIRHVGFSFHSTPEQLDEILTKHPEVEFVQLQINYADWESASIQSRANYEVARKHNKPVVIMEPVKGGFLATPPQQVTDLFKKTEPDASPASWAIRFAASLDGVITVLSGMSSVAQMKDNLSFMKDFKPLSGSEKKAIADAQDVLSHIPVVPCTGCNYCAKVCPNNIGISGSFAALNLFTLYHNKAAANGSKAWTVKGAGKKEADQCLKCGKCEQVCPQHIKIRDELVKVTAALG